MANSFFSSILKWSGLTAMALLGFAACKKDNIAPFRQDVAFIKYFGHVMDQEGVDVQAVRNADGVLEYLIFGSTYSFSEQGKWRDFYLVKTDSLGNEIWSRKYGNDTEDQLNDRHLLSGEEYDYDEVGKKLVVLADGTGYLLAGTRQRIETDENGVDVPKEKRIALYMVGTDGAVLQSTINNYAALGNGQDPDNMYSDELNDIKQLVDTDGTTILGYVLTGATTNVDTSKPAYQANVLEDKYDIYTARLELDLSPRWERIYGFVRNDKGTSVEIAGNSLLVVGTSGKQNTNQTTYHYEFIVVKYTQQQGNLSNQSQFGDIDEKYDLESAGSCYDAENDVLTAFGHTVMKAVNPTTDDGKLAFLQITSGFENPSNPNNEPTVKLLEPLGDVQSSEAKSIYLLPNDGGFVASATSVSGTYINFENPSVMSRNIHILKFNTDLAVADTDKDHAFYGFAKDDYAGTVVPLITTFEGSTATEIPSFVFTGTFDLGTNRAMGLVKVNYDLSFDPDGEEE